ncbi:protein transporter Sec31 [Streptomyces acidiscabies]|uniref:Protein transporter Sec31 n=1 Tax=Streptomyces acidiscabies TaxID=42234 RepID=A0ABU4LVW1_9ACTN|nr:protein transporter Sec31 [Streptomyces acidiscabies]MDX3019879.1 protein transporter Sec31 [Streptomyces acidiscabies]
MKTRRITREHLVPHTVDGKTRMVPDPVTVEVPVPPRDWDQAVLTGVTYIAALVLTASVVWSTASIGDLLTRVVIAPAAYGAAIVFDLAWIACMAIEWLARYDAERAALPRRAGHAALAVAMLAVGAHGWISGYLVIGIVGAVVSCLAKGLWTVLLDHQAPPLDPRTRAYIQQELAEAGASLALIPARRRVQRAQALVDAERTALDARPDRPDESADDQDADILTIQPGAMNSKDAVRIAWDSGIRDDAAATRYASKVMGKAVSPDTVARYMRALRIGA